MFFELENLYCIFIIKFRFKMTIHYKIIKILQYEKYDRIVKIIIRVML